MFLTFASSPKLNPESREVSVADFVQLQATVETLHEMVGNSLFKVVDPERGFIEVPKKREDLSSVMNMFTLTFREKELRHESYYDFTNSTHFTVTKTG